VSTVGATFDRRRGAVRRGATAALSILVAVSTSSCAYLGFVKEKRSLRRELAASPSVALSRRLAPENCFVLTGELLPHPGRTGGLVVAALTRSGGRPEIVGARTYGPSERRYDLFLPEAEYVLLAGADRDGDGFVDETEVEIAAGGRGVRVAAEGAEDGLFVRGPAVAPPDRASSGPGGDVRFRVAVRPHDFVVPSLDDPLFAPELGELGMFRPIDLLTRTQGLVFALEPWDPDRTLVLFVHGALGTPRDFRTLASGLDRTRFQAAFFYYPSGMPLGKLGTALAEVVRSTDALLGAGRLVVVAHSMGGLVSRDALREVCEGGCPARLAGYVSFASPYGGMESARIGAERAPEPVPSWVDLAPGSPFLSSLFASRLPSRLPFHLFFAWGNGEDSGPGPAGDGTVTLVSQLRPEAQGEAVRLQGFAQTHTGILEDPGAVDAFHRLLGEIPAAPLSKRATRPARR
jgi:pimeloyl-ACP methyl ester carboxylesterase